MGKHGSIPDRWEDYRNIGDVIQGTRFVAFKVPLCDELSNGLPRKKRFTPRDLRSTLPDLGLIIDLTFTSRYYNKEQEFEQYNIQHSKILVPGRRIPSVALFEQFVNNVNRYTDSNKDGSLIGVHCTHGLNRTGYFICRYMIEKCGFSPKDAIAAFETARGHQIERPNYVSDLMTCKPDTRTTNNAYRPSPHCSFNEPVQESGRGGGRSSQDDKNTSGRADRNRTEITNWRTENREPGYGNGKKRQQQLQQPKQRYQPNQERRQYQQHQHSYQPNQEEHPYQQYQPNQVRHQYQQQQQYQNPYQQQQRYQHPYQQQQKYQNPYQQQQRHQNPYRQQQQYQQQQQQYQPNQERRQYHWSRDGGVEGYRSDKKFSRGEGGRNNQQEWGQEGKADQYQPGYRNKRKSGNAYGQESGCDDRSRGGDNNGCDEELPMKCGGFKRYFDDSQSNNEDSPQVYDEDVVMMSSSSSVDQSRLLSNYVEDFPNNYMKSSNVVCEPTDPDIKCVGHFVRKKVEEIIVD